MDEAFRSLGCPAPLWDFARPLFVLGWEARGADLLGSLVKTVPAGELHSSLRSAIDDTARGLSCPPLTAQEYAAQYTMGRAPYAQGERGADY